MKWQDIFIEGSSKTKPLGFSHTIFATLIYHRFCGCEIQLFYSHGCLFCSSTMQHCMIYCVNKISISFNYKSVACYKPHWIPL